MNKTFQVISPIDGTVYLERAYANDNEIEKVLATSEKARIHWKKTPIGERANFCTKAVKLLVEKADEIGHEITMQMGRPIRYTASEITGGLEERAKYMIDIAEESLKNINIDQYRFIKREPLGTVLVLAPWNYPFLTAVNAIIPAIMAGNTVILKHSDQTPLAAERFMDAFTNAGLPAGVFQYLHIDHAQVATLINDERISHVSFTGSVEGGKAIQKALSKRFINVGLELGGKDPAYVREDADLDNAVENCVDGAFFNSGQSCCGIERIYVHEKIYDDFVRKFASLTRKYIMDNPLDQKTQIGPMVKRNAAIAVANQIKEAVSQGAERKIDLQEKNQDAYLFPEVLTNVTHKMSIMKEETFGPVVGIMAVMSDDEAISLMNDSDYGLTASIWTQDMRKAQAIGDQLETGTVFMNRCDYLDPALAWTGVKNSGKGCSLSSVGYESLTKPKSFHFRTL